MAKRRKKTSTRTRRRRRVSGIGDKMDLQALGLAIAGGALAVKLTSMLGNSSNTMLQKVAPFAGLGAGIILPMFAKDAMVKQLSVGLVTGGGIEALKRFDVISGFRDMPVISGRPQRLLNHRVNGVGYPLPNTSVYRSQMSVVNGVAGYNPTGAGAANHF